MGSSINDVTYFLLIVVTSTSIVTLLVLRLMYCRHEILDPFPLWPWRHLWMTLNNYNLLYVYLLKKCALFNSWELNNESLKIKTVIITDQKTVEYPKKQTYFDRSLPKRFIEESIPIYFQMIYLIFIKIFIFI